MSFLPDDYVSPSGNSGYMRIQEGENKIRILSSPVLGWEDWRDKKPLRYKMDKKPSSSIDPKSPIRHFWAFVVWDYADKSVKIFEVIQATIRKRIESLSKDSDWGSPYFYDLKILKSGQKTDTEYVVNPLPSNRNLPQDIKDAFAKKPINLEELYTGQDPFSSRQGRTLGFWEQSTNHSPESNEPVIAEIPEEVINIQQMAIVEDLLAQYINPVDPKWKEAALKAFKITGFGSLKKRHYDLIIKRIEEKRQSLKDEEIPF